MGTAFRRRRPLFSGVRLTTSLRVLVARQVVTTIASVLAWCGCGATAEGTAAQGPPTAEVELYDCAPLQQAVPAATLAGLGSDPTIDDLRVQVATPVEFLGDGVRAGERHVLGSERLRSLGQVLDARVPSDASWVCDSALCEVEISDCQRPVCEVDPAHCEGDLGDGKLLMLFDAGRLRRILLVCGEPAPTPPRQLEPDADPSETGRFVFDSCPSMELFENGRLLGRTPISVVRLPGIYSLEMRSEFPYIHRPLEANFTAGGVREISFRHPMPQHGPTDSP